MKKLERKLWKTKLVQAVTWSRCQGLYTGVRGTAELLSALSDLYLDTETLDNVQKAITRNSLLDDSVW